MLKPTLFILSGVAVLGVALVAWHPWSRESTLLESAGSSSAPANAANDCLQSGDGFLRARLDGSLQMRLDWKNGETHCEGDARPDGNGIRLSFSHVIEGQDRRLLIVLGIAGLSESSSGRALPVNVTIIEEGRNQVYGTLGDDKCVVDQVEQKLIAPWRAHSRVYRVSGRGFCLQPALAVGGSGRVLMTTFDFAGPVTYESASKPRSPDQRA